jgi:uncharacterized protein YdaU (DUF1376 family)
MDVYYVKETPLSDEEALRLIGAKTKAEIKAVKTVLSEFWSQTPDGWTQDRCDHEIERAHHKAGTNRENGKAGGRPKGTGKKNKPTGNPDGFGPTKPDTGAQKLADKNPNETFESCEFADLRASQSSMTPESNQVNDLTNPVGLVSVPKRNPGITLSNDLMIQLSNDPTIQSSGASASHADSRAPLGNGRDLGHCDPAGFSPLTLEQAQQLQAAYPKGIYRQSEWLLVEKLANFHLEAGVPFEVMLSGEQRYNAQCLAREIIGTQYVLSPVKFFDRETPQFADPFPLPKTKAETRQDSNVDAVATWLARKREAT